MGFGTLFVGYLFLLNPGVYNGFTDFIGFLVMLYAMTSLRVYNRSLSAAFFILIPLTLVGGFSFVTAAMEFLGGAGLAAETLTAVAVLTKLVTLAFTVTLLSGLRDLARETEIPVLVQRATLSRFVSYIYYVLAAALEVTTLSDAMTTFAVNAVIPIMIFGLVVILLNMRVIYNCYSWICMPEDLDMTAKPSKIGIVNKFREQAEKIEADFLERRKNEEEDKLRRKIEKKRRKKK